MPYRNANLGSSFLGTIAQPHRLTEYQCEAGEQAEMKLSTIFGPALIQLDGGACAAYRMKLSSLIHYTIGAMAEPLSVLFSAGHVRPRSWERSHFSSFNVYKTL
jgi:hypothetical protein